MSLRKTLSHRLFTLSKTPSSFQTLRRNSGNDRGLSRFLHRQPFFQSSIPPDHLSLPVADQMMERIRSTIIPDHHLHLNGLPIPTVQEITVNQVKKAMRATHIEAARARLKMVSKNCVSYSEFVKICGEDSTQGDGGHGVAKALDESGAVVVIGDLVFLRLELIVGAIENMISSSRVDRNDPRAKELKNMEKVKAEIDWEAEALVRKELGWGLGLFGLQTIGFMRLTFWELSWDVMEPVCFFVTSIYFMAGYAFFLRTSRDPSFEGFFESRFSSHQKRLMETHKFDMKKLNELRGVYNISPLGLERSTSTSCDCHRKNNLHGFVQ